MVLNKCSTQKAMPAGGVLQSSDVTVTHGQSGRRTASRCCAPMAKKWSPALVNMSKSKKMAVDPQNVGGRNSATIAKARLFMMFAAQPETNAADVG